MTINSPARSSGRCTWPWRSDKVPGGKNSGTLQNDILKEYIAQKEYLYPPAPSMRLVVDTWNSARGSRRDSTPSPSRLSHPRGRFDRFAGTGVHGVRRHRIRGVGSPPRARC